MSGLTEEKIQENPNDNETVSEQNNAESSKKKKRRKKQTYEERRQKILELKERMIQRDNTRVVFARTRDAITLLVLVQAADLALKRIREGMGINYDTPGAIAKLEEHTSFVKKYAKIVDDLCSFADVNFKAPKWLREENSAGSIETEQREQDPEVNASGLE